ncbi:hypothetical protein EOI86_06635 [Hwanghaeella grinnelliae]|uniref:STAS/SEC14 domain-containing protein n=1 Tax=Hwanghaeella grinnelliae TaxID=2500179 RepID=A0A3S2VRR3_9PROT|nr:hypothetical protein [Hwanghaeella grinnelliae]RVU38936.1 hypothetical protein EOI86_06635 [Hwanghaeella grinnelliae]
MDDTVRYDVKAAFAPQDLRTFRTGDGKTYAIVSHFPEKKLIIDTWIGGFYTVAEFRAVLTYICDQFDTGRYAYWLADLRHLNSGFHHSETWLAEYAFPRVLAGGLVREAVVLPEDRGDPADYDVFGSASAALRKITDGKIRGFGNVSDAKAWLFDVG